MPTLQELARLGKPDLVAFVAPLLTELAALKARVEVLQAENAALRALRRCCTKGFGGSVNFGILGRS